jgi:hypothetical protein
MMVFQTEDRARARKLQANAAIQLALQGRWDDAVKLNMSIVELFPTDVEAYNRLGKAMTELGRYGEAKKAYEKALEIDPPNSIASKNLSRLATLGDKATPRQGTRKLSPEMFIEEMGKTGVTTLLKLNTGVAAGLTAGDEVNLTRDKGALVVKSTQDELIGEVEPRLAQRLIKLIEGGNQYLAAIGSLKDADVKVFIRETFQHPSQVGRISFTLTVTEPFRPYVKGRLIRRDVQDDSYHEHDDGDDGDNFRDADEAAVAIHKLGTASSAAGEEYVGEASDEE